MKKTLILIFTLFITLAANHANADYDGKKWSLGVLGGGGVGRLGGFSGSHDDYRFINAMALASYRFSNLVEMRLAGGIDRYSNVQSLNIFSTTPNVERNDTTAAFELAALFHFTNETDKVVRPYALTGIRVLGINAIAGIGSQFRVSDLLSLFIEADVNSIIWDTKFEGRVGLQFHL